MCKVVKAGPLFYCTFHNISGTQLSLWELVKPNHGTVLCSETHQVGCWATAEVAPDRPAADDHMTYLLPVLMLLFY